MKINMPVTNTEIMFDESEFMLTKTDLKGIITYANPDFIKTSGYSEAELIGKSHNIVRHPDMPEEAFEDLWRNLKAGKPWTGMVKNRTKAGHFYWVNANAAPVFENGVIVAYLSARRKPSRQQVEAADAAYRLFKEGKAQTRGLAIVDGQVIKNTLWYKLKSRLQKVRVAQRMLAVVVLAVMVSITQAGLGFYDLSLSKDSLKTVYEDRLMPVMDLGKISNLMLENRAHIRTALSDVKIEHTGSEAVLAMNPESASKEADAIEKNIETISSVWKGYMATYLTPEEKILATKFAESRTQFVKEGLRPAVTALRAHDYAATQAQSVKAGELFDATKPDVAALIKLQLDVAQEEYQGATNRYENTIPLTFGALFGIIAMLIWFGLFVARSITKPLDKAIHVFGNIASGRYDTAIDVHGDDEVSHVLQALKTMQTMLNVNENEQHELANKVKEQSTQYENQLTAISHSTGVIEFNMDGTVIAANDIFLNVLGYSLSEAVGQHHSHFVDAAYRTSPDYKTFWEKLNRGEAITGEFKRINKNGKEVWLQASYNPILCAAGKPYKVVQYATDITEQKIRNADFEGQIDAIGKSQGVVELSLDGMILKANAVYLNMLGYTEQEIVGKHVSMVMDPIFAKSSAYTTLWCKLAQGESDTGQYKRIAKDGKEVWIQSSNNPIYDLNGKPFKIVAYTVDITAQKLQAADNAGQLAAIDKIQGIVEFDLTGKVIAVNDNFARVVGYSEKEIIGNHHSMFVEASYRNSPDYKTFWDKLARGEADTGQYKRIAKSGKEVWLQASYNPIMDINGKAFKVVQYATDISEQHKNADALATAVEETQSIIEAAKDGDLSNRVSLDGKIGAIASLCDGVNALMDQMTEVIVQVRESGETINTAAGEIASGNNDLSSRTEQQASSLEETAASMEQLASTVKNNAENAKQANQLAIAASDIAVKGGNVVSEVVSTMSAINSSAKKIEDIISVIDGIAFQTNILALNAAVEAARAGEQGRGFAVVAGEVRNLAQRSASAAKEIKELITDSVSKTAEGTKQVETAGSTMQEIVSSVQRVTDIMGEITAASVEQSAGIDQVNTAVTSMDEVTQQNAALVEQAAAAAESLVEQAVGLMERVSVFRLSGVGTPAARTTSSKPALRAVVTKPASRAPMKAIAKSGTNDEEWEAF
ncbi:MAG: PAS domain S-box protein [Methylotenera sp.]|nr:PAS domain S-box protein [Methylotenera sp.]